jgi:hypothetical protein
MTVSYWKKRSKKRKSLLHVEESSSKSKRQPRHEVGLLRSTFPKFQGWRLTCLIELFADYQIQ